MRSKDSAKEFSFCLICAPETPFAECICGFILVAKARVGDDQII
jgi:hypothetical protein